MNIIIREFRIEDYDALMALWNEAQLSHRPRGRDRRERIEQELRRETAIFLVAETEGRLVGSVFGTHDGRKGWINRVAVAPGCRNQGIARKLVAQVEHRLAKLGIEIVACLIEGWNTESVEVFKRLGYEEYQNVVYLTKRKNAEV
jgi:ribosomal protein S18 acetylase RimI-like enzyme